MTKEQIIIIALIVVIIYLYYQQSQENNQSPLIVESPNTQKLRAELNHYQKLYENRVKKDLGCSEIDLEFHQLQQEKQSWQTNLQILTQLQNFHHLVEKSSSTSLDREQVNRAEALVEQITQPELKQLASWMVTDSAFILGHNNLLTKLADQEDKTEQLREQHQDHLRKINVLFDEQAQDYGFIDFNGLYSLLSSIAERERERAKISDEKEIKPIFSRQRKKK